jgi:hypothetical protein
MRPASAPTMRNVRSYRDELNFSRSNWDLSTINRENYEFVCFRRRRRYGMLRRGAPQRRGYELINHKHSNFLMDWITSSDRNTRIAIAGILAICLLIAGGGVTLLLSSAP